MKRKRRMNCSYSILRWTVYIIQRLHRCPHKTTIVLSCFLLFVINLKGLHWNDRIVASAPTLHLAVTVLPLFYHSFITVLSQFYHPFTAMYHGSTMDQLRIMPWFYHELPRFYHELPRSLPWFYHELPRFYHVLPRSLPWFYHELPRLYHVLLRSRGVCVSVCVCVCVCVYVCEVSS